MRTYHILEYNRVNSALLQPVPLQMKVKGDAKKSRHGIYKIASIVFELGKISLNQQKIDTNSFSKWGSTFLYLKNHRSYATFSSKLHFTKS